MEKIYYDGKDECFEFPESLPDNTLFGEDEMGQYYVLIDLKEKEKVEFALEIIKEEDKAQLKWHTVRFNELFEQCSPDDIHFPLYDHIEITMSRRLSWFFDAGSMQGYYQDKFDMLGDWYGENK